jgi:hypothetical protein
MSISKITSDYTERTKDISILQYPDASIIDTQTVLPQFGKHARFCSGVQKLAQRYTIILLTNITSQPEFPTFGTSLLFTLKSGISPVDRITAGQIFNLASYKAVEALRAYQSGKSSLHADEKIVNASLVNVGLYGGYAAFDVKINTEAGTSVPFLVPLPK